MRCGAYWRLRYVVPLRDVGQGDRLRSASTCRPATPGTATRFAERTSATIGAPMLYGARETELAGERIILRIAAPQTDIEAMVPDFEEEAIHFASP